MRSSVRRSSPERTEEGVQEELPVCRIDGFMFQQWSMARAISRAVSGVWCMPSQV